MRLDSQKLARFDEMLQPVFARLEHGGEWPGFRSDVYIGKYHLVYEVYLEEDWGDDTFQNTYKNAVESDDWEYVERCHPQRTAGSESWYVFSTDEMWIYWKDEEKWWRD